MAYFLVKAFFIVKAEDDEHAERKARNEIFGGLSDDEFEICWVEGPFKTLRKAKEALQEVIE